MPSATNVTPEFIEANHSRDAILVAGWAVLEKNPDTVLRTNFIRASELDIKAETREEFHTLMRERFDREIVDTKMDGDGPITAIKLEWDGDNEFDLEVDYEVVKNDKVAYELGISALIDHHSRELEKQKMERLRQKRAEQRKETQESRDRRELARLLEQYPDVAKELMTKDDKIAGPASPSKTEQPELSSPRSYSVWIVEAPLDLNDEGVTKTHPTMAEAAHYLWYYVQGRVFHNAASEFFEKFANPFQERYPVLENETPDALATALFMLNWEDACRVILWYFNYVDAEKMQVGFKIRRHAGPDDLEGTKTDLDSVVLNDRDHPLLDALGMDIIGRGMQEGMVWARECPRGLSQGHWFETPNEAISATVSSLLLEVRKRHDLTSIDLMDMLFDDRMSLFHEVAKG